MKKNILIIFLTFVAIVVLVGLGFGGYYVYNNYISPQEEEELGDSEEDTETNDLDIEEEDSDDEENNLAVQNISELSVSVNYDDTVCSWETYGDTAVYTDPSEVSDRIYEVTCSVNNIEGVGKVMINRMLTGGGYGFFARDMADGLYYEANDASLDLDSYSAETAVQINDADWTRKEFEYSGDIGYFNEVWYYPVDPDYSMMLGFDWEGFEVVIGYEIMITTTYSDLDVTQIQTALDQIFESLN